MSTDKTPEQLIAEAQAARVARHEFDMVQLRAIGVALEAEAKRLRDAGEPSMTKAAAGAFIAALPA